jgi:putative Mn2+ efflux pump MntP
MWWNSRRERAGDEDDEGVKIMSAATASTWSLMGLALNISLDELAVGFSFGLPLVPILLLIALQALLVSLAGQWIGRPCGTAGRTICRALGSASLALNVPGLQCRVAQHSAPGGSHREGRASS